MKKINYIDVNELNPLNFDSIIDVRSPAEFTEDHIPNSVNLPVLSDLERGEVGTLYKSLSPFEARKVGSALIAENVANHIKNGLSNNNETWRPLIYCWRGGQRSKAFATILNEVGWCVSVVEGGYKAYRKMIYESLYEDEIKQKIYLISGNTGTAKTEILKILENKGLNIVDLEGLAKHKGSVFGSLDDVQPTQKAFESILYKKIKESDFNEPLILEAESNKIGKISLPSSLWKKMRSSCRIVISAPVKARAKYLEKQYFELIKDKKRFLEKLNSLKPIQGYERIEFWSSLFETKNYADLAQELIIHHYDPRYKQSSEKNGDLEVMTIELKNLEPRDLMGAAEKIKKILKP